MDRVQAMTVFTRVVETGSFSRAADALDLPRPSVTVIIKQLEAHLKVRLLQRTTRHVRATLDGEAYHRRCLAILAEVRERTGLPVLTDVHSAEQCAPGGVHAEISEFILRQFQWQW